MQFLAQFLRFSIFHSHFEVCSNFSDFFLLFHFHGLNNRPNADNRLRCLLEPGRGPRSKLFDLCPPKGLLLLKWTWWVDLLVWKPLVWCFLLPFPPPLIPLGPENYRVKSIRKLKIFIRYSMLLWKEIGFLSNIRSHIDRIFSNCNQMF